MPTQFTYGEGYTAGVAPGKTSAGAAESETLSMQQHSNRENRETPSVSQLHFDWERSANVPDGNADAHADGAAYESVVPTSTANKGAAEAPAESDEGRDSAKRNAGKSTLPRTQSRTRRKSSGLDGVREAARKDSTLKFTALLHHVDEDRLTKAFFALKKQAAVGVDRVTWREYKQNLEANITDLHGRIHRGAYRALPSRRVWIPKPDGRQRPLGIATLEDKIVQQAVLWVLQSIYEEDFLGFSYGFRPGRSQHDALDALTVAITDRKVNWILDADVEGYFDAIDHQQLIEFLEHRIGDQRILRLIRKWLKAGIVEDGVWSKTTTGSPQGAVISPLLANVFLHYVFDLWIEWWRTNHCHHDVIVVRYADDFVIGFQNHAEAKKCLEELQKRFAKHGLRLHEGKTRLIEFGRYATERRKKRGQGRPDTFDFLGFTHMCAQTRTQGRFTVHRHSVAKRVRATLLAIKQKLRKRMHWPIGRTGRWLHSVVQGWLNYHAVPGNMHRCARFVEAVTRLWLRTIRRRSQRGRSRWTWERMSRLAARHLPRARIVHPYPHERFRVRLEAGTV